jgi:serine/alanine adding enzyme
MSYKLSLQEKQILSDPPTLFSSQYPDADSNRKNQLSDLCMQLQSCKKKVRAIQTQSKIVSRQIGDAKKNNQPTDELMQSMQAKSTERKQFEVQLEHIEKQILSFFVTDEDEDGVLPEIETPDKMQIPRLVRPINNVDHIIIKRLENEGNAWNDYVSKQPAANMHHLVQWREIFEKTYGIESFYFFAQDNNEKIIGVLPLVRLKSRLFGDLLVSMPYFQRGGVIADHPLIEQALVKAANAEAARLAIDHIEYRDDTQREGMPTLSHKVNMVLSLPNSEDALWSSFTPKLRAQIKRPQRLTPQVVTGGKELLDDFYKIYTRNMRDLGSPAHSKQLIQNILDAFSEESWLVVIRMNNRPVSAGLLLGHKDTMEIPLASTIRTVNPHSMNMLLYWEVLKLAIKQGYNDFDFGRSSKDAGTYRFKQQWGAQPKQLYWHYWLHDNNAIPSINPNNPKYRVIIWLWKRIPVWLANFLGTRIIRYIP